jgi:hypothetical protein
MLDTSYVFAPHLYLVMRAERERVAESRKWLRTLREFQARDREQAIREITIDTPAHLAGTHKF